MKPLIVPLVSAATLLGLHWAALGQVSSSALQKAIAGRAKQQSPPAETKTAEPVATDQAKPPDDAEAKKKADEQQKKTEEQQKKAARTQKVQQAQFDRRPSAILKAWSATDDKEPEKKSDTPAEPTDPNNPPAKPPEKDPFDDELKMFARNVTLSNWPDVKAYLASIDKDLGKALYRRLLQAMQVAPAAVPPGVPPEMAAQIMQSRGGQQGQHAEKNVFSFDDVLALADAAPGELEKDHLPSLGAILRGSLDGGNVIENLVARLHAEQAKPDAERAVTTRETAKLLFAANYPIEAGQFLPPLDKAKEDKDHEALNLLSRHYLALHAKEKKIAHLEQAWLVTQAVLASTEIKKEEKEEALKRAVELAPKIKDELGQTWLEESFTARPQRGMEIIATIGTGASQGMQFQPHNTDFRLNGLQLQTTAVEALLKAAPQKADEWRDTLHLLAANWLREATHSYVYDRSTSLGPRLQRDPFGNMFYMNDDGEAYNPYMQRDANQPQAIKVAELLQIKPSDAWLKLVKDGMRPKFDMLFAQLYLKVGEDAKSFPYVEQIARTHPEQAKGLVEEFLRVWTRNHDPNADRNRTNYYMYMYGFERRAEGIPLTRSKQERNLTELSELVARLKSLPLGELNQELLAKAFTTCHSSAEVYRLEAIERVFGPIADLKPATLAELAQQMRANLAGLWREPEVQKNKKTNRKQKDIQAEVLRGYGVARAVVEDALEKHPGEWSLQLAKAAIDHDENNYHKELGPDSQFSERRGQALAAFANAAAMYAKKSPELTEDEETTKAYEIWFYAALGACDLGNITEQNQPDLRQSRLIREAIRSLPGEAAERHMSKFANALFTRMSAAKPAVKFRYLREGFEIVGDHKQAHEARKVFDYYKDLVTEIKLETAIDGSDVVGHNQPFGVFVNIRHTREIERESGGFGRYLQNQNANMYFSYNYGRPTENYREKFQDIVKQSLDEHFEVLSVTFQDDKVNSRAIEGEYGWRYTPYAYLLLKARGPEIDKLPPLRLDLDFLDTSGYAILPIESATVPLDAAATESPPRPIDKLTVTQTLDERQSHEGKLILEVKATAQGLVPDLDHIVDVKQAEFDVVNVEDQGVSVSKFDAESDHNVIASERTWLVTMHAKEGLAELPTKFRFAAAARNVAEMTYQRYEDADLATAEREISLEARYGEPTRRWPWVLGAVVGVAIALVIGVVLRPRHKLEVARARFQMPESITPFTVLGLLKQIDENNGLDGVGRDELHSSINRIERFYFDRGSDEQPDLNQIAETWVRRTS
jgi:hypothetical protein